MARRWTTNQYMARYERRLERKAFNKMWDDVTHPPSPDGTRRCENCAKNGSCTLNRRGNHGACFVAIAEKGEQENNNEASGMSPIAVFFLVLGICAWLVLAFFNITIALVVLILIIIFL